MMASVEKPKRPRLPSRGVKLDYNVAIAVALMDEQITLWQVRVDLIVPRVDAAGPRKIIYYDRARKLLSDIQEAENGFRALLDTLPTIVVKHSRVDGILHSLAMLTLGVERTIRLLG